MISDNDKKQLKRHQRLLAMMIEQSIGYFTPIFALQALDCYKTRNPFYCEWYYDMASKRQIAAKRKTTKDTMDIVVMNINDELIQDCWHNRHRIVKRSDYWRSRKIVLQNAMGSESIGAAWF